VKLQPGYQLLKTIPRYRQLLATTIMLEAGPVSRLRGGEFRPTALRDSCVKATARRRGRAIPRMATNTLPEAFMEAANFALMFCPEAKRFL